MAPVLEEIIHERVEERQKGTLGSPVIFRRFRCSQVIVLWLQNSLSVSLSRQLNNLDEDSEGWTVDKYRKHWALKCFIVFKWIKFNKGNDCATYLSFCCRSAVGSAPAEVGHKVSVSLSLQKSLSFQLIHSYTLTVNATTPVKFTGLFPKGRNHLKFGDFSPIMTEDITIPLHY